jgi:hypothetical protein
MKISDIIEQPFVEAFGKLLRCEALSRQERKVLKALAAPILIAQKRFQATHNKLLNEYGERDADGHVKEVPLGNGMSKFKIRPESEPVFQEQMAVLRDEDIELPAQRLNVQVIAPLAKLLPIDEMALVDLLDDTDIDTVADGAPSNVTTLRTGTPVQPSKE